MKKNYKILLFSLGILFLGSLNIQAQNTWINEIHYDNSGGDVGEFIEVVLENAGSYTLSDFTVTLYNGNNGSSYGTPKSLDEFTVGINTNNFTIFYYTFPSNGIQNGAPDGMALDYQGTLITGQFLSYEGTFTGVGGPADGVTSTDIGVAESSSTQIGESLQLSGSGSAYGDFTWQPPAAETPGLENNNQTLGGALDPEPDNYPTAFVADGSGLTIELTWTDAVGGQLPSGYVIIASDQNNIVAPVDGVALTDDGDLSDGTGVMNISYGVEFYAFKHLLSETTYYFEIYPYTNGGANIDYKNDGTPPATEANTDYAINVEYFEVDLGTWTEYSVIGDQVWHQDSYGGSTYAKVSGYSGGSNENEDWLISPSLNLDLYHDEVFNFSSAMNYTGNVLEVLYSDNYDGVSDPNSAVWMPLNAELSAGSWVWTGSGDVDLSGINGSNIYLAFKYTSTDSQSSTWEIDDILITGLPNVGINNPALNDIKVNVFPNPAFDEFNVTLPQDDIYKLDIYSLNGKVVKSALVQGSIFKTDISDLDKGVYFIRISSVNTKNISTKKLIVL